MILHIDLGIWKELSTFFLTESNTILAILSRFYTFILRSKTFVHYSKSKIHDSYFFQLGTLLFPPLDLCKKLLSCKRRAYNVGKKWKKKCKERKILTSRLVNYHFEITSTNHKWNAHFFVFWSTFTCPFCLFELHFFKIRSTFYSEQTWKDWLQQLHLCICNSITIAKAIFYQNIKVI